MALVKYGGGIVSMSGKMAGNVHARNKGGDYIRSWKKPINPNSARQQAVRAALAFCTDRWAQTLTAAQRLAWNVYAAGVAMTNRLGDTIHLSGFNHYIRSNVPYKVVFGATIDAGPGILELPAQDPTFATTASEATQWFSITHDVLLDWTTEDGAAMFIYQGLPQNAQRNFFAGPWRYMANIAGAAGGAAPSPSDHAAVMIIAELQHLWLYARIIRADGRLSEPFRADCFCAA